MAAPTNFIESLSPFQRRLITSALALVAGVVICLVLFGVFLLLRGFVEVFSGVLWPLAVAGIMAMILKPLVRWLEERVKLSRIKSIIVIYLIVLVLVAGLLALTVPVALEQFFVGVQKLPKIWGNLREAIVVNFPQFLDFLEAQVGAEQLARYQAAVQQQVEKLPALILPATQDLIGKVRTVIALGTGLAIVPVYLFFFLQTDRDPAKDLKDELSFLREEWREDLIFLLREFAGSMVAFFRGQIMIGVIMGVLLAFGFSIAGIDFGISLGLLIGALNIIPYFGTIIGLGTVLPIAYFQPEGGFGLLGIAAGIFVAVQMIEGYLLTPRIMGKQTGLHPLTIIIAIFFWGVALNGVLGMIMAIPLTAFFVVAWRLVKRKYLARLTANS